VELQGLGYQEPGIKVNKYLYNGMEYVDDLNLNIYSAFFRSYDPTIGRWWQMDPKSEKYMEWSPYHAMGNNPISISDPLGDEWKTQEDKDHADQISARLSYIDKVYARDEKRLESRIAKAEAKGKEKNVEKLSGKKDEISAMRQEISNAQTELAKLGEKDGMMFRFNNLDPSTSPDGFLSTDSDGTTVINTFKGSLGNEVHELKHAFQAREGLIKGIKGSEEFKYPGIKRGDSEIEAYRRQYSVTQKVPTSEGGRPTSIYGITPHFIRGIYYVHPSLGGKVKPYSNFGFTK
jgi:RHS repeat-associated protein